MQFTYKVIHQIDVWVYNISVLFSFSSLLGELIPGQLSRSVFGVSRPTCMEEGLRWWPHCSRWWNTAQVSIHNHTDRQSIPFINNGRGAKMFNKSLSLVSSLWAIFSLKYVKINWRQSNNLLQDFLTIWLCTITYIF